MKIAIRHDVQLFVDVEGSSLVADGTQMREKPTLILLHGGPGYDHTGFKPAFSQLADIAQIIYYDHRGHGRSNPRPMAELTLDHFADDLVALCSALGISKPIVLGQSFGGFVAQHYLAKYPDHPSKVILSSTSAALNLERKLAMFEQLGGPAAREAALQFWSSPNTATLAPYQQICKPLYSTHKAAARRSSSNHDILLTWAATEQQTMNLLPGLAKAQCPVLVLAGELDPVCPLEDAKDITQALPSEWMQFTQFAGCGHGVWRDDPEAAFARIREFITESKP
ncbi:alpha/beta fold hydrolase [Iodobacter fluviatilis]|uniref:Proline iminopeptidase n=1 Tax=Iodobacter fluviatilis TaxID=537 RepID=A0A377Q8U7_9NEIS|nr:alpha/beta hydrolase [Iodobacter fluviatilis]TCU88768.1 proline iminopeptidase [Iodobacter fluviatilis]STQ91160.1 Proline iminopeptidase [Iodobacter fluviatilis]